MSSPIKPRPGRFGRLGAVILGLTLTAGCAKGSASGQSPVDSQSVVVSADDSDSMHLLTTTMTRPDPPPESAKMRADVRVVSTADGTLLVTGATTEPTVGSEVVVSYQGLWAEGDTEVRRGMIAVGRVASTSPDGIVIGDLNYLGVFQHYDDRLQFTKPGNPLSLHW